MTNDRISSTSKPSSCESLHSKEPPRKEKVDGIIAETYRQEGDAQADA
jgi:hypothetical protein